MAVPECPGAQLDAGTQHEQEIAEDEHDAELTLGTQALVGQTARGTDERARLDWREGEAGAMPLGGMSGACLNSMRELVYSLWQTGHVGTWHDSEKADCSSICRWQATCMYRSRHAHTPCTSDEIGASCVQMKHSPNAASLSSPITWTAVPGMASLEDGSAARSTARLSGVPALPLWNLK